MLVATDHERSLTELLYNSASGDVPSASENLSARLKLAVCLLSCATLFQVWRSSVGDRVLALDVQDGGCVDQRSTLYYTTSKTPPPCLYKQ